MRRGATRVVSTKQSSENTPGLINDGTHRRKDGLPMIHVVLPTAWMH